MRPRSTLEVLIRYVLSIGLLGALFTLALDQLATAEGAPAGVHTLVIHGSAGLFALAGVALYNAGKPR
jgi:hypothetical protein